MAAGKRSLSLLGALRRGAISSSTSPRFASFAARRSPSCPSCSAARDLPSSTRRLTTTAGARATAATTPSSSSSFVSSHGNPDCVSHSLSTASEDAELRALFDAAASPPSLASSSSAALMSSGLFGHPELSSPASILALAERTLSRAKLLVNRILRAPVHASSGGAATGSTSQGGGSQASLELRKVVKNLDRLSDLLCSVIDMAELVRNVHPEPHFAEAANAAYEYLCSYMNVLNTHTGLYEVLSHVMSDPAMLSSFSPEERAVARIFLRDFEKSGIHLPKDRRKEFVKLSDEILVLGRQFLQDASSATSTQRDAAVPREELEGMGTSFVASLQRSDGSSWGKPASDSDLLAVPAHSWEQQMISKFSPSSEARRLVHVAINSSMPEQIDTLEKLLRARAQLAKLVGNKSYAEVALVDKMAKGPENVMEFLSALAAHQRPLALTDLRQLSLAKQMHLSLPSPPPIAAWDREYYSEMVLAAHNHRALAPINSFFSVGTVFTGLSRLFNRLYGLRFRAAPLESQDQAWHEDVRKLEVVDESEGTVGWIYADLYTRPGKPPSAAHYTVRCSRRIDDDDAESDFVFGQAEGWTSGTVSEEEARPLVLQGKSVKGREGKFQLPVVVLVCDFARPSPESGPSLLSWHEVETLFHEMGHAIHSMIGRTNYHNVSGTRCATDFVELPSILMEHFVSDSSVLSLFARHHRTGAALPMEHLRAHIAASKCFEALDTHSQILMATLDQVYHSPLASFPSFDSTRELAKLHDTLGVIPSVPGTSWQTQFGHLFGYGATYYSYLFDRAIASRVWQVLFKRDPLDREMGERFKKEVLRFGGGKDPWEMVSRVLEDDSVAEGDTQAMQQVGRWGIDSSSALSS